MTVTKQKKLMVLALGFHAMTGGVASAQELQQINVMTVNESSCSVFPQITGQAFGFFERSGVEVNLLSSETSVPYVAFLANGTADLVMLDSAQVLQAAQAGLPISVVYEAYQFAPEVLIVPADSETQSLDELAGKTIGLAADRDATTASIALNAVGLSTDDVTLVVVGTAAPTIINSFTNGSIAAFSGSPSDTTPLDAAGFAYRNITPPEISRNPGNSFVMSSNATDEQRQAIAGFLRGWAMGQHAGILDTPAVIEACKDRIPEQWEDETVGMRMIQTSVYSTQLGRTKQYGELQPDVWAQIQPSYVGVGEIDALIDTNVFLDPSYIEAANNFTTDDVKAGIAAFREAN